MLKFLIIGLIILAVLFLLIRAFNRPPREIGRDQPKMITMDGGAVTVEVEGQEFEIDPAVLDEVRQLSDSGQKIEAIKRLREATGLGLTEAKQIVDSLDRLHPKES